MTNGGREPALVPGSGLVLDAGEEPALAEPVVVVPARPMVVPPALEDDDEALAVELEQYVDRVRLWVELDERLEELLKDICLIDVRTSLESGWFAPDGVPALGRTAHALAGELQRRFGPGLKHIRAADGTDQRFERQTHVFEKYREHVSDATNRGRVVDALVTKAGAHYGAEWLPPLNSADPRGARERDELRAQLEARLRASVEAAGEAMLLNRAGIKVEGPLSGERALGELLDDGGFSTGLSYGRAEREPVRRAVERWREHCETHLDDLAAKLLDAMLPTHWESYRKTRRQSEAERVPTREEREQAVLDATRSAAPAPPRGSPNQGPDRGHGR